MGNAVAGYGGIVSVGGNAVAHVKQWELPLALDLYDSSELGTGWKLFTPGLLGSESKIDVFLDLSDTTGQLAIQNAIFARTLLTLVLTTSNAGGATAHTYTGSAYVKGMDIKDPVNAPEEASLTLTFTGAITPA